MSFGIGNPYKTGGQSFTVQGQGFAQGTVGFVQLEGINYPVGFQLEANKSHHKDHNHHNHHHHKEHHHQTDNHFYP